MQEYSTRETPYKNIYNEKNWSLKKNTNIFYEDFSSQSQIDFLIIHFMEKEVRTMLPNGRLKLTSQLIDRMLLLFKTQLESRHMPKANWD